MTPERIQQMAFAFAPPLLVEAAIEHQVFDLLHDGPKTVDEMVAASGASPRGMRALLNGLVALELLARQGDAFGLSLEAETFLVSGKPDYQGGMFRHISHQLLPHWLKLSQSVKTGRPSAAVNQQSFGGEFFREFVEDLFPRGYAAARRLGESLGIASANGPIRVLDLAAGSGVWSIALAEQSDHVSVTAVDWAEVIPVTRRVAERRGVADRYAFVSGDLLKAEFGEGYQVATLGQILHSEGESRSRQLLKKVFDALAPGGTIAIAEILPNEQRTGPPAALIFAVNMLVHTDEGDTYSFGEISKWLSEAGFVDCRELPAPGPFPLVLATRPE